MTAGPTTPIGPTPAAASAADPPPINSREWLHLTNAGGDRYLKGGLAAANVYARSGMQLDGDGCFEAGRGVATKGVGTGKICYSPNAATGGTLDITGGRSKTSTGQRTVRVLDALRTDAVQLGDKFRLGVTSNDNWLRVNNATGSDLAPGGLATRDLLSTGTTTANALRAASISTPTGVQVTNSEPGALVEKNYGSAGNRYGVGQFSGASTRVYAAGAVPAATVSLSMAKPDGNFTDALTASVDGSVTTNGIKFTKAWTGSPDNARDRSEISNDAGNFKSLMIVGNRSAGAERRVSLWDRLDVNGTLNVAGNTVLGRDVAMQGKVFFKDGGLSTSGTVANGTDPYYLEKVTTPAGNVSSLRMTLNDDPDESFQIWGDSCAAGNCGGAGVRGHELTANGNAWHRGSLKANGAVTVGGDGVRNNVVIEGGKTSDGTNAGFSAINFNGSFDRGEKRTDPAKSRWRVGVDQRGATDRMFVDQYRPDGSTWTPLAFENNKSVAVNGDVTVASGASRQHSLKENGAANHRGSLMVGGQGEDRTLPDVWGFNHGMHARNPDGRWTHFAWKDGTNFIRGPTVQDGNFTVNGTAALNGDVTVASGLKLSKTWTASPDGARDRSEISNDTASFKKLMIVGNKSAGAERRVGVWDRMDVHGNLGVDADATINGKLCVRDKCITRDQLATIMTKAGL